MQITTTGMTAMESDISPAWLLTKCSRILLHFCLHSQRWAKPVEQPNNNMHKTKHWHISGMNHSSSHFKTKENYYETLSCIGATSECAGHSLIACTKPSLRMTCCRTKTCVHTGLITRMSKSCYHDFCRLTMKTWTKRQYISKVCSQTELQSAFTDLQYNLQTIILINNNTWQTMVQLQD